MRLINPLPNATVTNYNRADNEGTRTPAQMVPPPPGLMELQ